MDTLKKSWKWLRWIVAIGAVAYLYYRNQEGINDVWARPKHWGFLLAALALCGSSTLVTFLRWFLLVRGLNFVFRVGDAMRLGFIGLLFNYVGPGSVGGDLFKAAFLARQQTSRRTVAVATILLDRVLGLLALFLVGALTILPSLIRRGFPTNANQKRIAISLLGVSLAGVIGLGLMMWPRFTRSWFVLKLTHLPFVGKMAGELIHGIELYQSQPRIILSSMILSIIGHGGLIAGFYCGALAVLPWAPTLAQHFSFMPIAELIGVLVPTPAGIGGLEKAIEEAYAQYADSAVTQDTAMANGIVATLVFRIVTMLIASIGGIYYLLARSEVKAAMQEAEHLNDDAQATLASESSPAT